MADLQQLCPKCGNRLESSTGDLCPACLLRSMLEGDDDSLASDPLAAVAGDSFGNYAPVGVLGEGGMGVVFLAEQRGALRRRVALKVLKNDLDTRAISVRFERERQTLARLDHPNIVTIFDAGVSSFLRPYFVMEVVNGLPITRYCDERRLTVAQRVALFGQVCAALEHAHRNGIVHRDLKPSNVLVVDSDSGPRVKVIDFGIAKIAAAEGAGSVYTQKGQFAGTPGYMSPEQAGVIVAPVGPRSDIYSLGALLYELLCGHPLFDLPEGSGSGPIAILRAIKEDDPVPPAERATPEVAEARGTDAASLRRQLKGDLEAIVSVATAKLPERRYENVSALAADLTSHLVHRPVVARRPGPLYRLRKWSRRNRLTVAVAGILMLVTAAVLLWRSRGQETLSLIAQTPYSTMEGVEQNPAFSPDGRQVVFNWNGAEATNYDLYVSAGAGETPRRLTTDPQDDVSPSWSPDGKEIAFVRCTPDRRGYLMVIDPVTGREQELLKLNSPHGYFTTSLDWSPDGKWIVVLDRVPGDVQDGLHLIHRATGERHMLTRPVKGNEDMQPSFGPDGRSIAFTRDDWVGAGIWVQKLTAAMQPDGPPTKMIQAGTFSSWFPNGDLLFRSSAGSRNRLWRLPAKAKQPLVEPAFGDSIVQATVSRDGRKVMTAQKISDIDLVRYTLLPDGKVKGPERFAQTTVEEYAPVVSPDGSKIAFVSYRSGGYHLWLADTDGRNLKRLSMETGIEVIRWSPDGRYLFFTSRDQGVARRFRIDVRTGEQTPQPAFPVYVAFSRDGKWAYVDRDPALTAGIFRIPTGDPSGKQITRIADFGVFHPAIDPEGEWVYFTKLRSGPMPLWRIRADGSGHAEIAIQKIWAPYFLTTPMGIYYTQPQDPNAATLQQTLLLELKQDHRVIEIAKLPTPLAFNRSFGASPDGRTVYLPFQVKDGIDLMLSELPN